MTLRMALIGGAVALGAGVLVAALTHHATSSSVVLGASLVAALVRFERSRYRSRSAPCPRAGFGSRIFRR